MDRRSFLGGLLAGVPVSLASLGRAEALAGRPQRAALRLAL